MLCNLLFDKLGKGDMKLITQFLRNIKTELIAVDATRVGKWWDFKNLNSPFSRLYLITAGAGTISHHNKTYELSPGTLHLVPRFSFHTIECDDTMDHYFLHFLCEVAEGFDIFTMNEYEYSIKAPENALNLFKRLIDLNPDRGMINYESKERYRNIYAGRVQEDGSSMLANSIETEGLIKLLIAPHLRTAKKCISELESFEPKFLAIFKYINENIDKRITLEDLAEISHLNSTYFSDKFKKVIGVRPTRYITKRRLEIAQVMLMDCEKNLSEIAYATGFCDLNHFNKTFKKTFGVTPAKYRQGLICNH